MRSKNFIIIVISIVLTVFVTPIAVFAATGDVSQDGKINAYDALEVLQHAAKIKTLNSNKKYVADVNEDGSINATDALRILQYSAKLIDGFGYVSEEVYRIDSIVNQAKSEKSSMTFDGGTGYTRYYDKNLKIHIITVTPEAYYSLEGEAAKCSATYYYDIECNKDMELPCYVEVRTPNGKKHSFYIIPGTTVAYTCIRYVDANNVKHDYEQGISPNNINLYGQFCDMAYLEILWSLGY